MLGKNTTGLNNKKHYYLGLGCLYISELDSVTGLPDAYRLLGEAPEFTIDAEIENIEHKAICSGLNVVDDRVEISKALNLSVTLEEISHENSALFFSASQDTPANPALAGLVAHILTAAGTKGVDYAIKDPSTFVRAMGLVQAVDVALVHDSAGTPVPMVLDTDYTVDLLGGMVHILSSSALAIDGTKDIQLTLTANAGAPAVIERVQALNQTSLEYALKFRGVNGRNGKVFEVEFHSVRLSADGELGLLNPEEYASMTLTGVAQINSSWPGTSKTMTISKAVDI